MLELIRFVLYVGNRCVLGVRNSYGSQFETEPIMKGKMLQQFNGECWCSITCNTYTE
jgi:hypothetical protein